MKPVIFRQLKSFDLNSVYRWVKEIEAEDTFVTMNPNEPLTSKEVKDFIQNQIKKSKQKNLVKIGVFVGKKYLGGCDIEKLGKRQTHIGSFGIVLLKECRGQGIGYKLAQKTIQLAKEKLGIQQVVLNCFVNNEIGINFYKKLGFKQYGLHPKAVLYKGKCIDEIMFYKELS
ncbi:MAG: GNAT family protein [Patescibacteria group bacterium]